MLTKFEIVISILSSIIGVVIASVFYSSYYNSGHLYTLASKAIAECELNIPRNQHCTIVGVVKENK